MAGQGIGRRGRRGGLLAALGLTVAGLVAAGCSVSVHTGSGLDVSKLQDLIKTTIQQATGVAPTAVNCPTSVNQGKGNNFQCTATLEGQTVTVDVTQTDDAGHVTVKPADALILTSKVDAAVRAEAQKQGADQVQVDCGSGTVIVAKVGSTFTCTADAGAGEQTVVVTVKDLDGNVRFEFQPASGSPPETPSGLPTGRTPTASAF